MSQSSNEFGRFHGIDINGQIVASDNNKNALIGYIQELHSKTPFDAEIAIIEVVGAELFNCDSKQFIAFQQIARSRPLTTN